MNGLVVKLKFIMKVQKPSAVCFFQCNFFDYRGLKVVYRRYTAFCFITGITDDEVRQYKLHKDIFIIMLLMFILSQ